jgi:hypothetical protein
MTEFTYYKKKGVQYLVLEITGRRNVIYSRQGDLEPRVLCPYPGTLENLMKNSEFKENSINSDFFSYILLFLFQFVYGLDDWMIGVRISTEGWDYFSTPCPDRLWGPPSLLSRWYRRLFSQGMKLTTHLHLVSRPKNAWSYTSTPPISLHGVVLS